MIQKLPGSEPGLAAHLTQNARRKVEQFDWGFILPQWLDLIEKTRLQSVQDPF